MDMEHIKVVFFDPSPPFVDMCVMVLCHWNTPHSTMEAMWTYKVHLCAHNWKAHYIFYLAE
jgi:hypothetical protein